MERDSLAQIFHAFVLCQYFDAHFTDFNVSFCVRIDGALVAENLRLVWVNPESHFLGCFLAHNGSLVLPKCENVAEHQQKVIRNLRRTDKNKWVSQWCSQTEWCTLRLVQETITIFHFSRCSVKYKWHAWPGGEGAGTTASKVLERWIGGPLLTLLHCFTVHPSSTITLAVGGSSGSQSESEKTSIT